MINNRWFLFDMQAHSTFYCSYVEISTLLNILCAKRSEGVENKRFVASWFSRFKELTMYREVFSLCNSSRNITLNKHLDLKKKKNKEKAWLWSFLKRACGVFCFFFKPWRWYKGFNVGKQAHHAKWDRLYRRTLSFTHALIRGICTSLRDCPLSHSR